ncbi:tetratricopeptide repeat protein [Qipengyuania sp. MTN3-11]|uniref:tetratricopeptide repeat protein n=1 Tax=Qipengyuania sp. MTN3-11 TaxID=3056557 RepID=UPI0036F41EE2
MTDVNSAQFWIVVVLAVAAWAPATYVWRYLTHANAPRDITLPPEDLSWKSTGQLLRCVAILAALVLIGTFVFTPWAKEMAGSRWFPPIVLGGISSLTLGTLLPAWRNGEIEPLIRGLSKAYSRTEQPVRYWASMAWNGALGLVLFGFSLGLAYDLGRPECDDRGDLVEALASCELMLAEGGLETARIAEILADRGRIHYRLENFAQARADYTAAIEIDPENSHTFYNRGLANVKLNDPYSGIEDFSKALALRPDDFEAYFERGMAHTNTGRFDRGVEDFTQAHRLDPDNSFALANRSVANAWLNNRPAAERDFAEVSPHDEAWLIVLHAKAILALEEGDERAAIAYLTDAIKIDPKDLFALHMRADAYWDIGELDLARDDDDRLEMLTPQPGAIRIEG